MNLWVQGQFGSGISGVSILFALRLLMTTDRPSNEQAISNTNSRDLLRKELRARRRALTPSQQASAAAWVLRNLTQVPSFMRSKHVAIYIASDGEIDPQPIAEQLWKMDKYCYLPVLHPTNHRELWFVRFTADTPLKLNRYKIPEPDHCLNHKMPPHLLDVVLVPLVGFDRSGARLGMGGGFYDTTFAFQQHKKGKPCLLGIAHACQEVPSLEPASWDIPLHGVVTDKEVILC